ncbi:MAG: hypothetical protein SFW36_11675 [Leptolyngbyaceae cyanobacterium bins.59]|nr:hypothetical protein [Leptolyngbyaceae cyanobacterium bins.59]
MCLKLRLFAIVLLPVITSMILMDLPVPQTAEAATIGVRKTPKKRLICPPVGCQPRGSR